MTPKEKAQDLGVPIIGGGDRPIRPLDPTVAVCGVCGIELKQVMHYVCMRIDCPTGLGPTVCQIG